MYRIVMKGIFLFYLLLLLPGCLVNNEDVAASKSYIEQKYNKEFNTDYVFDTIFLVRASPVDNPQIIFNIRQGEEEGTFKDDYLQRYWEWQVDTLIREEIASLFPLSDEGTNFTVHYSKDSYPGSAFEELPSYKEVDVEYEIALNLFETYRPEEQLTPVYEVIQILLKHELQPTNFSVSWVKEERTESVISSQVTERLEIPWEQVGHIKTAEDLVLLIE